LVVRPWLPEKASLGRLKWVSRSRKWLMKVSEIEGFASWMRGFRGS
jgi:hypothetical protein